MRQQSYAPEITFDEPVRVVFIKYSDGPGGLQEFFDLANKEFPDGYHIGNATGAGAFTLGRYVYGCWPIPKTDLQVKGTE